MRRSRGDRGAVAGILIAALLLAALPAAAQRPPAVRAEAQPHLNRALRHYDAREYAAAAQATREAYAIDPRPELLYMWAQSERLSGDCGAAVPLYRRFLETAPADEERARAEKNLARCEAVVAAAAPAAPVVAPPPASVEPAVMVEAPATPPQAPWYRDAWGMGLGGAGVLALGAAGGLELAARAALADARNATDYAGTARGADTAADRHRAALAVTAVGTALIVGAVVRYVIRAAR